jgi:hypothetical protein
MGTDLQRTTGITENCFLGKDSSSWFIAISQRAPSTWKPKM